MQGQRLGIGEDFSATYMAVQRLRRLADKAPCAVEPETVRVLGRVLTRDIHAERPQAGFLYRDAAGLLTGLTILGDAVPTSSMAYGLLGEALATPGRPRMAAAEALGAMPLSLRGPALPTPQDSFETSVAWTDLLRLAEAPQNAAPRKAGRSLIVPTRDPDRLLVAKFLRQGENPACLVAEAAWMDYFQRDAPAFDGRFDPPAPLIMDDGPVARIQGAPINDPGLHPERLAMGYLAHKDYFRYPNEPEAGQPLDPETFLETMAENARLLGQFASRGVIHEAVIPLFHNRAQQHRRPDGGLYDWRRMGRLDRWLGSARFPNIGLAGPRDFEHLHALGNEKYPLYKAIGDHILGLVLVAGSAFRLQNPELLGQDQNGNPVDARHLFDRPLFRQTLETIFHAYHRGFVGQLRPGPEPFDMDGLTSLLIDAMGVDNHMFELLRVVDQQPMSDESFHAFVTERGLAPSQAAALTKDAEDIPLPTGPHLGDFNGRISVPELLEFTACAAAACISGRFFREKG